MLRKKIPYFSFFAIPLNVLLHKESVSGVSLCVYVLHLRSETNPNRDFPHEYTQMESFLHFLS